MTMPASNPRPGPASRRTLAVLGSSGSIGLQTLDVAARERDRLEVVALAAGRSLEVLCAQAALWRPRFLALEQAADPAAARRMLADAARGARVEVGEGASERLAADCGAELVVNGIVGAAGLAPSLATLDRGARLALANKESMVVGGPLIRQALERQATRGVSASGESGSGLSRTRAGGTQNPSVAHGFQLLPVDSEHSAALQCLLGRPPSEVARLTLTASGGPLRRHPDWRRATRAEVLAHPVWAMGARITTDSATLFNKGLEIIEAHFLFDLPYEKLDAVIHPNAMVHAIATFTDGSLMAQVARADMRLPIQLALSWPERWGESVPPASALDLAGLEFEAIAPGRFPMFDLALAAGRTGGTAPCVLNAADEVAVQAFLDDAIALGELPGVLARVLEQHAAQPVESLAQLREVDAWAREAARAAVVRA